MNVFWNCGLAADLMTQLALRSEVEKESSSEALDDAASSLIFIASGSDDDVSHECANLDRVLETPLEWFVVYRALMD